MKKRPLIILVVVVLGLGGYLLWKHLTAGAFPYAGTIEADEVDISTQVSSPISSYEVQEGDRVKAGQTLVKLDCQDIRINADQARVDFNRAEKLFKAGSMPQSAYDHAKFAYQDTGVKVSWCDLSSPIDGTVLETYHQKGEWVRPGVNLLTLANLKSVYAIVYIPQTLLAKVSAGEAVKGTLPEMPGKDFAGVVAHIREDAEFTPKNVQTEDERARLVYGVKIHFENPDEILKPGMTIEVRWPEKAAK